MIKQLVKIQKGIEFAYHYPTLQRQVDLCL